MAAVKSIFVYPIKSCRGISPPQAPISSTGFRWDRQWVVVNSKGRACTQRVEPKLSLVQVDLPNQAFSSPNWEPNQHSYLVITAPGMSVLKIPLATGYNKSSRQISVWEWSGSALDEGDAAAQWFSMYLEKPGFRLMRFNHASEVRSVDTDYAQPGNRVMFSDGYPFLLLSQGSLNALNARLKEPLPINRFRPNILVNGCEPFSEDLWSETRINEATFQGVKLCARCKVPTINQETAVAGSEPTETMMTFRSDRVLRPTKKKPQGKVYFGQNMVCNDYGMIIKVGDPVYILKTVASAADAPA